MPGREVGGFASFLIRAFNALPDSWSRHEPVDNPFHFQMILEDLAAAEAAKEHGGHDD